MKITAVEWAKRNGVPERTLYNWIESGLLSVEHPVEEVVVVKKLPAVIDEKHPVPKHYKRHKI